MTTHQPKISVVVPAYQAEQSLGTCLDSLLCQTMTDMEVIVVDDGSTDKTAELASSYVGKDQRVRLIRQNNAGVSAARNKGMEESMGQWVVFADCDDWMDPDYLTSLLPKDSAADFVVEGYTLHKATTVIEKSCGEHYQGAISQHADLILHLDKQGFLNTVWAKLFSKDIITRNHIQFPPEYCYGEDKLFVFRYLNCCTTIKTDNQHGYHYVVGTDSLSTKTYPVDVIWKWNEELLNLYGQTGTIFHFPEDIIKEMMVGSYSYFTLYMANAVYEKPLSKRDRTQLLTDIYNRRRGQLTVDWKECKGKTQKTAALLYKMNIPSLSDTIYRMVCKRRKKGMMR